eukprot:gnl/TRDRNA2_/TRDRNA2_169121_c0_seq2.p1 gnl/TRDRNA2_/TRDRNA2_169121_c0~~gnl/TRDRNA2_/TRDRNA2_169121_c0_seq2.p1  ORF type:complete len:262 (-),score=57.03 gnl/TRDRNA2_/TRDRNA2_169121_c0_seq2:45-830(-)
MARHDRRAWAEQLKLLSELGIPSPRFVSAKALVQFAAAKDHKVARKALTEASPASSLPTTWDDGELECRIFAVSVERDACCPAGCPSDRDLQRLGKIAETLEKKEHRPLFFLVPGLCVEELACLRAAASCSWPLYLQLCHALVCVDTEHRASKAWCRIDQALMGGKFMKPVYILAHAAGSTTPKAPEKATPAKAPATAGDHWGADEDGSGWLLSDKAAKVTVGPAASGQVLPGERALLEAMADQVVPGGARANVDMTCYKL